MRMHAGQLEVEVATVRRLVREQHPRWAGLEVRRVASYGTVNAIFRIGDGLVARFPLQAVELAEARAQLEVETAAAQELLGRTRFATPEPVATGEPGADYPMPWSVQTWIPGTVATDADPSGSQACARDLAELVDALRVMDTRGRTFDGTNRGGDLRLHDAWVQHCVDRSEGLLDVAWLRRTWAALRTLPRTAPDVMSHCDLIPGNLLVTDGRLIGVLDVGELAAADPALDLVAGWHGLDAGPRRVFRESLGCDDLEWARGAAWAFEQAVGVVWYYAETNPTASRMGRRTLARLRADLPVR